MKLVSKHWFNVSIESSLFPCYKVPNTILRSPRKQNFQPDQDLQRRISLYFARIYDRNAAEIRNLIPLTMTRWGKVRIANGGDKIRARCAVSAAQSLSIRDSSFIRVCLIYSIQSLRLLETNFIAQYAVHPHGCQ
jgi:hypothetical protein